MGRQGDMDSLLSLADSFGCTSVLGAVDFVVVEELDSSLSFVGVPELVLSGDFEVVLGAVLVPCCIKNGSFHAGMGVGTCNSLHEGIFYSPEIQSIFH